MTHTIPLRKVLIALAIVGGYALLLLPFAAFAHETRTYEISGVPYSIVVGSLNEPVIVDDKTGVSISITRDGELLTGAQESLQAEMIAGTQSRVVALSPVHGAEGQYKSDFIATVPTELTYRFFGELEGTPVDLVFACNPAGHPQADEDTQRIELSEGVFQTLKRGAFGCPQEKDAFGFPEAAPSSYQLERTVAELAQNQEEKKTDPIALTALLIAVLAGGLAVGAYTKKK